MPLHKNPGLQSIKVEEVLGIITIVKDDVAKAVGIYRYVVAKVENAKPWYI